MRLAWLAAGVLLMASCGKKKESDSPSSPDGRLPDTSVKQIFDEWKADKAAADGKYGGKTLQITGQCSGVYNRNENYYIHVSVDNVDGNKNKIVECHFDNSWNEKLKPLRDQWLAPVTVAGTFSFDGEKFVMKESRLVLK